MTIHTNYIQSELLHVAPFPIESVSHFKIQLINDDTGNKTKFINITAQQFKEIENILMLVGN